MEDLIFQTSQILQQSSEIFNHPVVGVAMKEMIGWLGGQFGKDSAKEKLKRIEEGDDSTENLTAFEAQLEFILDDNENLQKELAEKVQQIQQLMVREGISIKTISNTMNVSGDHNISIQDVDSKGDINISN